MHTLLCATFALHYYLHTSLAIPSRPPTNAMRCLFASTKPWSHGVNQVRLSAIKYYHVYGLYEVIGLPPLRMIIGKRQQTPPTTKEQAQLQTPSTTEEQAHIMDWADQKCSSCYESSWRWIEDTYLSYFGENRTSYRSKGKSLSVFAAVRVLVTDK